jgi:hypothetical protein
MAPRVAARAGEGVLWVVGALLTAVGALILWNLVHDEEHDSDPIWFVFGAAVNGGLGLLLLRTAWGVHQRGSAHRK